MRITKYESEHYSINHKRFYCSATVYKDYDQATFNIPNLTKGIIKGDCYSKNTIRAIAAILNKVADLMDDEKPKKTRK